jgi:hypothetical protein
LRHWAGEFTQAELERLVLFTNAWSRKSATRPFQVGVDVGLNTDQVAEFLRILNKQAARCGLG